MPRTVDGLHYRIVSGLAKCITIVTGELGLQPTHRWREPDSNHRSRSYDQYPNGLKKAPELCAHGQSRCVRVKCAGGIAILIIGASGRSPAKTLSMIRRRARVHERRLAWRFGWQRSGDRSVLGCAVRASGGVA